MGGSGLPSERAAFAWQEGPAIIVGSGRSSSSAELSFKQNIVSPLRARALQHLDAVLLKMLLKMS